MSRYDLARFVTLRKFSNSQCRSVPPVVQRVGIGEWAEWPMDKLSQKSIRTVIEQIETNEAALENQRSYERMMRRLAPKIGKREEDNCQREEQSSKIWKGLGRIG